MVDCIITDPPYNVAFRSNHREKKFDVIENDDLDAADFQALLCDYFSLAYKMLKENSFLLTFLSWKTAPAFMAAIQGAGFEIKAAPIWVKENFGMGYYMRPQYEPMYLCTKGKPKPNGAAIGDVIHCNRVKNEQHSCQKPIELLSKLLSSFSKPGDLVFDGFIGSGSTAIAAIRMQRRFLGCEVDQDYYKIALERINETKAQPSLFDLIG